MIPVPTLTRGSSLLILLALILVLTGQSGKKSFITPLSDCLSPSYLNRHIDCDGKGESAHHLFLLFNTKLDLNQATVEELALIPKMTRKTAVALVHERDKIGGFTHFEQVDKVKGVGPKTLENLKKYAVLSTSN